MKPSEPWVIALRYILAGAVQVCGTIKRIDFS